MVVLTNFIPPTEGIKLQLPNTSVMINNRTIGNGTMFITESTLSWVNEGSSEGFSLEYPHISLHAVSKDRTSCPHENLYVMLDIPWDDPENKVQEVNDDGDDDEDEESVIDMTELRFIPSDKGMLDAMYHAVRECQALHPDPQDTFSEEDDPDIFDDEEEEGEYDLGGGDQLGRGTGDAVETTNGDAASGEPMEMDAGQFDDADGEPLN